MADIDSRLVVQLEATLSKFEKQMARARKVGSDSAVGMERQFQRSNRQIAASAERASGSMMRMTRGLSGRNTFLIQNTANQFGDLAVQIGSGTSASRALGQQLPQLLGAFGALGAVLGTVAAIGIPAAAFAFQNLGTEATTVEEALKEVEAVAETLKGPMAILTMDGQELADVYGEAAERVREFAIVQAELAVAQAQSRLGDQIQILDDVVDGFITSAEEGIAFERTLEDINAAFGTTRDQAISLEQALQDIFIAATTGSFEDGRAAMQTFLDLLREMDLPLGQIPEELQTAINETINLSNAMDAAAQSARELSAEAAGVTIGTPLTIPPGGAGDLLPPAPLAPARGSSRTGGRARSSGIDTQARRDALERERLLKSTRTEAEAYADELARLNDLHARGVIDADLFQRALDQMHEGFETNSRAIDRMSDAAAQMFTSIIDGSMSAKDAVAQLAAQLAGNVLQNSLSGFLGTALDGSGLSSAIGGLFANAKGNAFENGRVTAFASGGVVTGPTMFPMQSGAGLMGEAGPEAIMPLVRMANGKLGVQAMGAGAESRVVIELGAGLEGRILQRAGQQSLQLVQAGNAAQSRSLGGQVRSFEDRGVT